jgi:hypothetical protein
MSYEDRPPRILHTFTFNSIQRCKEGLREGTKQDREDAASEIIILFHGRINETITYL